MSNAYARCDSVSLQQCGSRWIARNFEDSTVKKTFSFSLLPLPTIACKMQQNTSTGQIHVKEFDAFHVAMKSDECWLTDSQWGVWKSLLWFQRQNSQCILSRVTKTTYVNFITIQFSAVRCSDLPLQNGFCYKYWIFFKVSVKIND